MGNCQDKVDTRLFAVSTNVDLISKYVSNDSDGPCVQFSSMIRFRSLCKDVKFVIDRMIINRDDILKLLLSKISSYNNVVNPDINDHNRHITLLNKFLKMKSNHTIHNIDDTLAYLWSNFDVTEFKIDTFITDRDDIPLDIRELNILNGYLNNLCTSVSQSQMSSVSKLSLRNTIALISGVLKGPSGYDLKYCLFRMISKMTYSSIPDEIKYLIRKNIVLITKINFLRNIVNIIHIPNGYNLRRKCMESISHLNISEPVHFSREVYYIWKQKILNNNNQNIPVNDSRHRFIWESLKFNIYNHLETSFYYDSTFYKLLTDNISFYQDYLQYVDSKSFKNTDESVSILLGLSKLANRHVDIELISLNDIKSYMKQNVIKKKRKMNNATIHISKKIKYSNFNDYSCNINDDVVNGDDSDNCDNGGDSDDIDNGCDSDGNDNGCDSDDNDNGCDSNDNMLYKIITGNNCLCKRIYIPIKRNDKQIIVMVTRCSTCSSTSNPYSIRKITKINDCNRDVIQMVKIGEPMKDILYFGQMKDIKNITMKWIPLIYRMHECLKNSDEYVKLKKINKNDLIDETSFEKCAANMKKLILAANLQVTILLTHLHAY
jgi:hypothetical protein